MPFIVVCILLIVKNAICLSLLEAKCCIVDFCVMLNIELLFLYVILFFISRGMFGMYLPPLAILKDDSKRKPNYAVKP